MEPAGKPGLATWDAPDLAPSDPAAAECRLPFCDLWIVNPTKIFCTGHDDRWQRHGRPDPDRFIADCELVGTASIDLQDLSPQLKLEIQYALQCRHDARSRTAAPRLDLHAVRHVQAAGVTSLLDLTEQQWRQSAPVPPGRRVGHAPGRRPGCAGGAAGRDRLGDRVPEGTMTGCTSCPASPSRQVAPARAPGCGLTASPSPGCASSPSGGRDSASASGLSIGAARAGVDALICFSTFLALAGVDTLAAVEQAAAGTLSRPRRRPARRTGDEEDPDRRAQLVLPEHPAERVGRYAARHCGVLPRRHPAGPRAGRPPSRRVRHGPGRGTRQPGPLAQLRRRLTTLILTRCGLRISSALALDFDCLLRDGQGAPYLRYFNTKMRREAAVPIDEELETAIRDQQRRVLDQWPDGTTCLFPRERANVSGNLPLADGTYRRMLGRWLETCEIRDEHGRPVHLTPHQWRHTFACRLINRDVPQEVVRVLLDHDSHRMTSHYAKITDQTVRRHWEQAIKVNIKGERVTLEPGGLLDQAQWAKTRYGMATQTLSNGYCGLPIQKSCPHANACLTCPVFLSGPEFLPELREQRHRTLTLIEVSTGKGQTRVAEMNQRVLTNLDRMIGEIAKDEKSEAADAG